MEAARMGAIFASGKAGHKAYRTWRRSAPVAPRDKKVGLTGMDLEQHIGALHRSRPDLVALRAPA